jgi:hypothetical protein
MLTGFDLCRAAMTVEGITAPEQSVLLVLAVMANDDAQCWPPINGATGLTSKTKLSERTVQRAVQGLKDADHINWVDKPGRGRTYVVHPRQAGTSRESTPVTETPVSVTPRHSDTPVTVTPTPVTVTPKLPVTTNIPQKASPSSVARTQKQRGTMVPADFSPTPSPGSLTAKAMSVWPPGEVEEQVEHFIDHHTHKQTTSPDWQACWRTWVKNWKTFNGNRTPRRMDGKPDLRGSRPDPAYDLLNISRAAEEAQHSSGDWSDYRGDWTALPAQ